MGLRLERFPHQLVLPQVGLTWALPLFCTVGWVP